MSPVPSQVLPIQARTCGEKSRGKSFAFWKGFFGQDYLRIPRPDPRRSAESAFLSGVAERVLRKDRSASDSGKKLMRFQRAMVRPDGPLMNADATDLR